MGVWQAIDAVGWGLMDKAYFVFDSAFWPDDSYFIIRVSPAVGEWVLWVNLHKVRLSNTQEIHTDDECNEKGVSAKQGSQ